MNDRLDNIRKHFKNINKNIHNIRDGLKDSIELYPGANHNNDKDMRKAKEILIDIVQHCITETDGLIIRVDVGNIGYNKIEIELWDCSA